MRKFLFLILAGVLGATLFAGVASAASVDLDGDRLWAKGSGVVIVRGDIENAHVRLAGDGQRHRLDNGSSTSVYAATSRSWAGTCE